MKITQQMIKRAREKGACKEAMDFLTAGKRSIADLKPEWISWAADHMLSASALAEYKRVEASAWAEYERVEAQALESAFRVEFCVES